MKRILVIDDDRDTCLLLNRFLTRKGYQVTEMYSGKRALNYLETSEPDLVLCDFRLDDMDATQLLANIKSKYPKVPVIIITGYGDIRTAVRVMKLGAMDYIIKPLLPDEIIFTIGQAFGQHEKPTEGMENGESNHPLRVSNSVMVSGQYIFGNTESFKKILKQVSLVGPTNYSVIVYGETGSGKESIAQEIHKRSQRRSKPFIAIDCGALSKELAASELFGHEKGSFTGALQQKIGSFELANGGTIFLDEVTNLSADVQASLLRVVQERKMRRVGGTKEIDLDVRIIVASNEKIWNATRINRFREDLFHRFNEFSIEVPPLRERKEDIMLFANHFLQLTNQELGKDIRGFSVEVEEIFKQYAWYGNLRELKNVVKRACLLTDGDNIESRCLPFEISNFNKLQFSEGPVNVGSVTPIIPESIGNGSAYRISEISLKEASIDAEYEMILRALKMSNYNKSKAAQLLKIDRKTLYNKMSQYEELQNH
jgi:two-component system response regulator HydG